MSKPRRDHHVGRPGRPRPAARRGLRRRVRAGPAGRVRRARRVPRRARQPLRARPGAVLPLRDPPLPPPRRGGRFRGAAACPTTATSCLLQPAVRRGDRPVPRRPAERRARATPSQRAGGGVPRAGLPDAGRPGAAQRPLGARATSGCSASAIRPTIRCGSGRELLRARGRRAVPGPARAHAGPHGPLAQRAGATSSSWAWTSPRARGCSTSRSTWACTGATPRRARRSRRTCASSTSRSCGW